MRPVSVPIKSLHLARNRQRETWLNNMPLPKDIQAQLTANEKVRHSGAILEGVLYVTDKRILFRSVDASSKLETIAYSDILSIDAASMKRNVGWVIIGIAILLVTFITVTVFEIVLSDISYILIGLVSVVMIIVGFYKVPSYSLTIAGKEPLKISSRNITDFVFFIQKYRDRELSKTSTEAE